MLGVPYTFDWVIWSVGWVMLGVQLAKICLPTHLDYNLLLKEPLTSTSIFKKDLIKTSNTFLDSLNSSTPFLQKEDIIPSSLNLLFISIIFFINLTHFSPIQISPNVSL